jgi:diaminohydroxyphosphoribosylaminopyrimidine deaminase/5-amino-6-(5-phosphoribosylamino)uracil reductase
MVEGGGAVTASFLEEGLTDSLALFIAPKVLGDKALPWVGGAGISALGRTFGLGHARIEKIGRDFLITGRMGK